MYLIIQMNHYRCSVYAIAPSIYDAYNIIEKCKNKKLRFSFESHGMYPWLEPAYVKGA